MGFAKQNWRDLLRDYGHVGNYRLVPSSTLDVGAFFTEYFAGPKVAALDTTSLATLKKADLLSLHRQENAVNESAFAEFPGYWTEPPIDEIKAAIADFGLLRASIVSNGGGTGPGNSFTDETVTYTVGTVFQSLYDQLYNHESATDAIWIELDADEVETEYTEDKFPAQSFTWYILSRYILNGGTIHETRLAGVVTGTTLTSVPATIDWPPGPVLIPENSNFSRTITGYLSPGKVSGVLSAADILAHESIF